ncbi:MAG: Rv1678 family membrane protein [Thermocrispum sp.]
MTRSRLDVAAVALGAGAIAAALLRFVPFRSDTLGAGAPVRYSTPASVSTTVMVILLALGVVAVAGGLLGTSIGRWLVALAGLGLAAVAVLVLVQNVAGEQWLDGSRSAMALLGGLGLGLLAVGLAPQREVR